MSEMKSAWEKALEKAEKLGKPSEEELKKLEHIPMGNTLAARFLQEEKFDLDAEINKQKGSGVRNYIIQGAQEILMRNITFPHNEHDKKITIRALAGIKILKENKKQVDVIVDRINNLLSYYEQARQQSFAQFKKNFESKLQEMSKTLQQKPGAAANLEAQIQQQFQDEWRRASNELDTQYERALDEHRQQLAKLT